MKYLLLFLPFFAFYSCQQETTKKIAGSHPSATQAELQLAIESKKPTTLPIGQDVDLSFHVKGHESFDSLIVKVDFNRIAFSNKDNKTINISTQHLNPGKRNINISAFETGKEIASGQIQITLLSDIVPEKYTYKVIRTLPHNTQWYTQGFEFCDGFLYEGTGMNGQSGLYKVNPEKNEILQSVTLPDDIFGEGITILNDKVYQLTWRSQVGFVYDKNSLKKLYDFNYPTEGWGLTNNGKELIMSDGSDKIYFLDTAFLQESHHIEVYSNKGPVYSLNELELVNGVLYANVYQTDSIVAIDINSGKVLRTINLSGLLNKDKLTKKVDVLNGIAFNPKSGKWFVTGKWWPLIFQVDWVKE